MHKVDKVMTNTETCMREMRHISMLFLKSIDLDEQWILFKAYLNTVHSLSDNDKESKSNFHSNELMNFVLVLRNIVHHQPAKWHFGKHDVQPTSITFNLSNVAGSKVNGKLSLVIEKATLENPELQATLAKESKKQLAVLVSSLEKMHSHVIVVSRIMQQIQEYVEYYCKQRDLYTEAFDYEPTSYRFVKNA